MSSYLFTVFSTKQMSTAQTIKTDVDENQTEAKLAPTSTSEAFLGPWEVVEKAKSEAQKSFLLDSSAK